VEKSFALIKDGKVFNVISATQETINEIGAAKLNADEVVDLTGTQFGIGCSYSNGTFTRPEPPPEIPKEPTDKERLAALEAKIAALEAKEPK
jgi:hypothetical protein